jgi:putative transposase
LLSTGARPALAEVMPFIETHRSRFGVEPICRVLQVAPSRPATMLRATGRFRPGSDATRCSRPRSRRSTLPILGFTGSARCGTRCSEREGTQVVRCTVERLMQDLGLRGVVRGRRHRTPLPDAAAPRPADLVRRDFRAPRPKRLWVADLTYVRTWSSFAYVAFIIDAYSRYIVGWHVARSLHTDVVLTALEHALWVRKGLFNHLVHHSDRGVQYLSSRSTERLAEAGIATSVGSRGDSYDNALAETVNGLYKAELIYRRGPWRGREDLELATLEWVDWFNHRRRFSAIGYLPPAQYEASSSSATLAPAAAGTQ